MRLESRCYSSSAINNDSESALKIDTLKRVVHARNHNHNRNNTLENLKKEKNVNGILSFLQKFRVANKNYFVDSTFSLSSPQSSRRSNATDSRWQSIESVISSATATSFAFIPSHQLRLYGVREPTSDGFFRKYNLPEVNEEQTNINKFNRYSTGNLENTIGYDKNFNIHSNQETSTSEAVWIQKRKYCHKPGKRRAPQPPIEEQTNSKKIPYRRKKRKAPSPPRLMSSEDSLNLPSLQTPNEEDPKEKVRGPREEHTAVYNDSLKLEKGILKANKNGIEIPPNENGKLASAPVSPKPWYKRSVTKNSKKSGKIFEKRESCRNYIDEWLLESGLPRMKWPIDCGKRTSQLSMLANISALDREATEIIENERRKARETNNSANEERFYSFDYEDWKKDHLDSKRTKDLTSVFSSVTNVAKISQLKTLQRDETSERKKTIDKKEEKKANVNHDKTQKKTDCENVNINRKNSENVIKSEEFPTHTKVTEPVKNTPQIRPVRPFSSWTCPQCTMENPSWKFICEMCNKWRPYSVNRTQIAPISPKEDSKLKRNFSSDDKQLKNEVQRTEPELKIPLKTTLSDTLRVRQDLEKLRLARIRFFSRYQNNDGNSINSADSIENKECEQDKNKAQENLFYDDEDRKKLRQILKELKDSLPEKPVRLEQDTKTQEQNMKITNIGPYTMIDKTGVKEQSRNNEKKEHRISQDDTRSKLIRMESILSSTPSTSKQTNQILSTIKSTITDVKENRKITAIAINRLLKKLQTAIGNGQHHEAANIARELARLKVNCYMTRSIDSGSPLPNEKYSTFAISLYIQEKGECRGPIPLPIDSTMTLADLKMKIFDEFKIPPYSQRWVFEKITLNNEIQSLENIGIDKPGIPLYLNIISEGKTQNKSTSLEDVNLRKDQCKKYDQTEPPDRIGQPEIEENIETIHEKNEILQVQPPENELEKKTNLEIVQAEAVPPEPVASLSSQCSSIIKTDSIENIKNETVSLLQTTEEKIHSEQDIKNIRLPEASSSKQNISILPKLTQEYSKNKKNITINEEKVRGWPCDLCTFINDIDAKTCIICNPTPLRSNFEKQTPTPPLTKKESEKSMSYQELIALEKLDVILNNESFECSVCLSECPRGGGVVLRGCLHTFCCECLKQTIQFNTEAVVKCPYRDGDYSCESVLEEREIKALVSYEQYEKHLGRSITEAQNKIKNAFHCKTTDCRGWCIYEDNVNEFLCPVCCKTNCLTCRVIHMGLNCKQYQDMAKKEFENSADSSKTRSMLEEMIGKGEAMMCPTCEIILMKKWGCDWLRCSMCKTEICWVTRGPRWGPNGKGDTSGGCQCGVKGVKCHPKCNYCH